MIITETRFKQELETYQVNDEISPLLFHGNALEILSKLPDKSIDMCLTSPPYWRQRQYSGGGIGLEKNYRDYIENLCGILAQLKRIFFYKLFGILIRRNIFGALCDEGNYALYWFSNNYPLGYCSYRYSNKRHY